MAIPSSTCPRNPPRDANRADDADDGVAELSSWWCPPAPTRLDCTPPAANAEEDDDDDGGGGGGGLVVENDGIEDEMAEKKEETTPLSAPLSLSIDTSLELREALLAPFEASDLLFAPPLVPANNDDNEEFMDALLNRGGRGCRLWVDRNPVIVSRRGGWRGRYSEKGG